MLSSTPKEFYLKLSVAVFSSIVLIEFALDARLAFTGIDISEGNISLLAQG